MGQIFSRLKPVTIIGSLIILHPIAASRGAYTELLHRLHRGQNGDKADPKYCAGSLEQLLSDAKSSILSKIFNDELQMTRQQLTNVQLNLMSFDEWMKGNLCPEIAKIHEKNNRQVACARTTSFGSEECEACKPERLEEDPTSRQIQEEVRNIENLSQKILELLGNQNSPDSDALSKAMGQCFVHARTVQILYTSIEKVVTLKSLPFYDRPYRPSAKVCMVYHSCLQAARNNPNADSLGRKYEDEQGVQNVFDPDHANTHAPTATVHGCQRR